MVAPMKTSSSKVVPYLVEAAHHSRAEQAALARTERARGSGGGHGHRHGGWPTPHRRRRRPPQSPGGGGDRHGHKAMAEAAAAAAASITVLRRLLKDRVATTRIAAAEGHSDFSAPDADAGRRPRGRHRRQRPCSSASRPRRLS